MRPRTKISALFASLAVLAGLAAAAGAAPMAPGDGTLAVRAGQGVFVFHMRGSVIGRIERGRLTIEDPTDDGTPAIVRGHEWARLRGGTTIVYGGKGIRFRILGGRFTVRVENAVGVDLSAIGRGTVTLKGAGLEEFGLSNGDYSLNGGEFQPVPDERTVLQLRTPPRPKPTLVR